MALIPLRLYPDPILRQRCAPVTAFDDSLRELADSMVETMRAAPGVGLAAPQVGRAIRLAVIDTSVAAQPGPLLVLVNPELEEATGSVHAIEGCLSIPDFTERVERPEAVRVRAMNLEGVAVSVEASGLTARAICHEIDHLDGILFVDRLRGLRRERAKRALRRQQREADRG